MTGSATFTLDVETFMPIGTTGTITNGITGTQLGTFSIVPEPSAFAALAGILVFGLVAFRRRR